MCKSIFLAGATYAPLAKATEVDVSQWPADFERFASLGLNTVRLFISWDRIEQVRGKRDYSRVDLAFELAARHGIQLVANVGGTFTNLQAIYPPRWLVYDEKCSLVKPTPDAPEALRFNRFKLCYDSPKYLELAREFIQEAVARYKGHPQLLAWAGWNEPRTSECYCEDTIRTFRGWLERKYGGLDALAKAWSTEFPVYFRSWEDVFPQPSASFEDGGYIPWLDWRRFIEDNRRDKFNCVLEWIKEIDSETPVISHMRSTTESDIFGNEDILGTSIYTIHGQGKRIRDILPYDLVTRLRLPFIQMGQRPDRNDPEGFWIVETEAGPVSWVHNMAPRTYSPRMMNARDMLFVAYGARAVLRWLYRSRISDAQAGEFGMVGWDGRVTDRAREFGDMSKFLNRHAELIAGHTDERSGVFILNSVDCNLHASPEGYGRRYNTSVENLHNALRHIGVQARMCNTRQIMEGELAEAKVLFIPFRPHVDSSMAQVLREFVHNGGTLIAESPFAIKNTDAIHYEVTPGLMVDLFGVQVWDLEKNYEPRCGMLRALDFKAKMEVRGAEVEQCFADGDPAVVSHRFGKGRTVLYGSVVFAPYQFSEVSGEGNVQITFAEGQPLREELAHQLAPAGVHPAFTLYGADEVTQQHLHVYFRRTPLGKRLLFVLNMNDRPARLGIGYAGMERATLLGSASTLETAHYDSDRWSLNAGAWGWFVFLID